MFNYKEKGGLTMGSTLRKIVILSVLVLTFVMASVNVFAQGKNKVVLFCTSWNAKCKTAKPALQSAISNTTVEFVNLDLDAASAQESASALGLSIPRSIPYIVVLDANNNLINHIYYTNQTPDQLRQEINRNLR